MFVDELIYAELARSLADGAGYAVRETPVSGYSLLYPAVIAPAYMLFHGLVDAYAAAKVIGAIAMSLAAIPTYFLARRVASQWLALLAALTAVAVPSMAYTGTLTTECLFYPVSLLVALALVAYLADPATRWLVALLAALGVAFATRSQALAFVPAAASAPLVLAAIRGKLAVLRPFAPLYATLAVGATGVVVLQATRGRSLSDLLGAYSVVGQGGYDVGDVLRYWLWHVEELTLYSGIVPLVGHRRPAGTLARPPIRAAGPPRGDRLARGVVDARRRRVRVAVRLRPSPGPVPLLSRAAVHRRARCLGRARRATTRAARRARRLRGPGAGRSCSRSPGSSASRRSPTRSG